MKKLITYSGNRINLDAFSIVTIEINNVKRYDNLYSHYLIIYIGNSVEKLEKIPVLTIHGSITEANPMIMESKQLLVDFLENEEISLRFFK